MRSAKAIFEHERQWEVVRGGSEPFDDSIPRSFYSSLRVGRDPLRISLVALREPENNDTLAEKPMTGLIDTLHDRSMESSQWPIMPWSPST